MSLSNTIATTNKKKEFTISLTKAELDLIQKQFLKELEIMLEELVENEEM